MGGRKRPAAELKQRREAKRAQRDNRKHACLEGLHVTPDVEREVAFESSATGLAEAIRRGERTSTQVTSVLVFRSRNIGLQRLNAVTEELYDEALGVAQSIDSAIARGVVPSPEKVMLGIPVSIKDHVDVAGTDSTSGLAARCMQPKKEDALVVELLKDAGAIVYVKTNVPQLLMLPESENPVFGATVNPWSPHHSPGGSSGGEAALISARGSLVGIGTDLAGSIRNPSHCCGIYGFRPTPWRVSDRGVSMPQYNERCGQTAIKPAAGPMATCVDDLALVLRAWWVPKMWEMDPFVTPKVFDEDTYAKGVTGRRLKVGYFTTDNWFQPAPTNVRAVLEAKAALERAGYDTVEFKLPKDGWDAARIFYGIITSDGNLHNLVEGLEGEPISKLYSKLLFMANLPNVARPFLSLFLKAVGEERVKLLTDASRSGGISTRRYWDLVADLKDFQLAWLQAMDDEGIDAILCPGLAIPAWPRGMSNELEAACTYTFLPNLLHFCAGAVPATIVRADEAEYRVQDLPRIQQDGIARAAARALEEAAGLPVGVQVLARPNADELCLHVMKDLETHLGFKPIPPAAKTLVGQSNGLLQ